MTIAHMRRSTAMTITLALINNTAHESYGSILMARAKLTNNGTGLAEGNGARNRSKGLTIAAVTLLEYTTQHVSANIHIKPH